MTAFRTLLISLSLALAAFAFAPPAAAGDPVIDAAISAGEVGERIDGYLGVVGTADAATVRKVQDINNRRRAVYEQTAKDNGTTVQIVAQLAGEKQIAKLAAGQFYMDELGAWQRK
ncbi:YdbL family protein [Hyphomonas sp.]|uniref:YdbL family protein n=1 Tax=Hyphomonas sp. TaxID=87 RepID=UPI00391C02F5